MCSACSNKADDTAKLSETADTSADTAALIDPNAPVLIFNAQKADADGTPLYYLFDDNPEHLNPAFLADGKQSAPSAIAHFESLTPGIYTVFSYHHRGNSLDYQADLYFDSAFSSDSGGSFEILALGLNNSWDWNQAWADYTNTPVDMPLYIRSFNCTCGEHLDFDFNSESLIENDCPAIVRNESRLPKTEFWGSIGQERSLAAGENVFLSEHEPRILREDMHHFRYGGYNEPMWLYMQFRVKSGTVNFDTLAYSDFSAAKANFPTLLKGAYDEEPQYKGIADNAPMVKAEFDYTIQKGAPSGPIPITVMNMRVPDGYTLPDGTFATNANTWREDEPIAVQSDLMMLEYQDFTKSTLYGANVKHKSNMWYFDFAHNGHYSDSYKGKDRQLLSDYGVKLGADFVPNSEMDELKYPTGTELCTDDFERLNCLNLGNFGVTNRYVINLANEDEIERTFCFKMRSLAGQVYRYSFKDADGLVIKDDGGRYIMKCFDDDPAEDPHSKTDPPERLEAAEYGDTLEFVIGAAQKGTVEIEVSTLTGCTAPMHNTFLLK